MPGIKIFTTPTCPYCQMAKSFMSERGVDYEEIDVTKDRDGLAEMQRVSGQMGVPVITDGQTVIVGFNRDALHDMIGA
jgi:glutaredoxin-like YruB-family protein